MSDRIWEMLEEMAPAGCEAVQDLYSWSLNHDAGKGPFTLFLDLIGWTQEEYGEAFYNLSDPSLGYLELSKLSAALSEYVEDPNVVRVYVANLMDAERED
jgi:hypothetical protein